MTAQQKIRSVALFLTATGWLGMAGVLAVIYTAKEMQVFVFGPEIYLAFAGASLRFGSTRGLKRAQNACALAIVIGLGSAIGAPFFAWVHGLSLTATFVTALLGSALFCGAWISRRQLAGLDEETDSAYAKYWPWIRLSLVGICISYFLASAYGVSLLLGA